MTQWTSTARETLETYLDSVKPVLQTGVQDAEEVLADYRRHIDDEARARGLEFVTAEEVRRLIRKLDLPETPEAGLNEAANSASAAPVEDVRGTKSTWLLYACAFYLPLIALGVELTTRLSSAFFFNPLPTLFHVLVLAALPVSQLWLIRRLESSRKPLTGLPEVLSGIHLGICLFYALAFLPLAPLGCLAVLWFGAGLLLLSPLLALWASFRIRRWMSIQASGVFFNFSTTCGLAGALAVLSLFQIPPILTHRAMSLAASEDSKTRFEGVDQLRRWGGEEALLRACYGRPAWVETVNWLQALSPWKSGPSLSQARSLYYQVTGAPFNSVPPPKLYNGQGPWNQLRRYYTWDADQGAPGVAGRLRGLSLSESALEARADAEQGTLSMDWTLAFRNESPRASEVRMQAILPAGGVVHGAELTVFGRSRAAEFGGRSDVRWLYEKGMKGERHPLIVTSAGPDRVLVQCFSVPAYGGEIQIRLSLAAPLSLKSPEEGLIGWPRIVERNFSLPATFRHEIALRGNGAMKADENLYHIGADAEGNAWLKGALTESTFQSNRSRVSVALNSSPNPAVYTHPQEDRFQFFQHLPAWRQRPKPETLIVVLDGSAPMESAWPEIVRALSAVRDNIQLELILAAQGPGEAQADRRGFREFGLGELEQHDPSGGEDNLPALSEAVKRAGAHPESAVLWIHAPQPVPLDSTEPLRQNISLHFTGRTIVDFEIAPGPNRIIEELEDALSWARADRGGSVYEDLSRVISEISGETAIGNWEFLVAEPAELSEEEADRLSLASASPLSVLWAKQGIDQALRLGDFQAARELSKRFGLVTYVVGAVILDPLSASEALTVAPVPIPDMPAIPEPRAAWLLLLGIWFLWRLSRSRCS